MLDQDQKVERINAMSVERLVTLQDNADADNKGNLFTFVNIVVINAMLMLFPIDRSPPRRYDERSISPRRRE